VSKERGKVTIIINKEKASPERGEQPERDASSFAWLREVWR